MKIHKGENYNITFRDLHYSETIFKKTEFEKVVFENCIFEKCQFIECLFRDCIFLSSTLLQVTLPQARLENVSFTKSKIMGVNFQEIKDFKTVMEFEKSKVQYCIFGNLELKGLKMIQCIAIENDFIECDLSYSNFNQSDLEKSNFVKNNLEKASFLESKNYIISSKENLCKDTHFTFPDIMPSLQVIGIMIDGFLVSGKED